MDLPFDKHVKLLTTAQDLEGVVYSPNQPTLLYVYSPLCGYSVSGAPIFSTETRGMPRVYRYNAVPSEDIEVRRMMNQRFEKVFGFPIEYYPMVLGISKKGRFVEYNGPVTKDRLDNFLRALKRT
jgi:beta-galactosidase/beta-glucuronidase